MLTRGVILWMLLWLCKPMLIAMRTLFVFGHTNLRLQTDVSEIRTETEKLSVTHTQAAALHAGLLMLANLSWAGFSQVLRCSFQRPRHSSALILLAIQDRTPTWVAFLFLCVTDRKLCVVANWKKHNKKKKEEEQCNVMTNVNVCG